MDNVLDEQAKLKGFTEDMGDAMIGAAGDVDNPGAALALLVIGLTSKGVSKAMTSEADLRIWQALPNEFEIVPLQLPPGEQEIKLCAYRFATPLDVKSKRVTITGEKPLNVVHLFAYDFGADKIAQAFAPPQARERAIDLAASRYDALDSNLDGEVSSVEFDAAYGRFVSRFDGDGDGIISTHEMLAAQAALHREFKEGMIRR